MTKQEVEAKMVKTLNGCMCWDTLGLGSVDPERTAWELGMDSLDQLEFVIALEEEFGVDLPDQELESVKTWQRLVDLVFMLRCWKIAGENKS